MQITKLLLFRILEKQLKRNFLFYYFFLASNKRKINVFLCSIDSHILLKVEEEELF